VPANGVAVGTGVCGVAVGDGDVGVGGTGVNVGVAGTEVDPGPLVGVGDGCVPVATGVGVRVMTGVGVAVTGLGSVGVAGGVNAGDVGVKVGVGENRPFPSGSVGDESQPEGTPKSERTASAATIRSPIRRTRFSPGSRRTSRRGRTGRGSPSGARCGSPSRPRPRP